MKKKTSAEYFLDFLVMFGHDGDRMCLTTIKEKLDEGFKSAVTHYKKYLGEAEVVKLSPLEVNKIVKEGSVVFSIEGIIMKSKKLNVPEMNGKLLLVENMTDLCKNLVIVITPEENDET